MKSRLPKELQPVAGRPLIDHVVRAVAATKPEQIIVVLNRAKAAIAERLPAGCQVAWQDEQLGTGHAAAQAMPLLKPDIDHVAILFGDHPALTSEAVARLVERSVSSDAAVTLLTAILDDPAAYGRLRYEGDKIVDVVEAKADDRTYQGPVEINSGISCYRRDWLEQALPTLPRSAVGEYYLTSLVPIAARDPQLTTPVVSMVAPAEIAFGVNDRAELAQSEAVLRRRINERLMRAGVAIVDPATTFIDDTVAIGQDSRIEPFTTIYGETTIGEGCVIGPQSVLRDACVGDDCAIVASVVEGAVIGARVDIGPFSHLRPGAHLEDDIHVGNFGEIKNAKLGSGTKMGHFGYVGDATIGEDVNLGAGAVTANYDGRVKHRTVVGDRAFIGVNSTLRAPLTIGEEAVIGGGSVVTHNVEPGTTVAGVPARPMARRERAAGSNEGAGTSENED